VFLSLTINKQIQTGVLKKSQNHNLKYDKGSDREIRQKPTTIPMER
jgi:hypothetical protein